MGFDEAFQAADMAVRAIRVEGLRDIDRIVLEGSWNRLTYQKIALDAGYTEGYLSRDIGPALWALLSEALGMQVKKTNFRNAIERWSKQHPQTDTVGSLSPPPTPEATRATVKHDTPPIDVSGFRGRDAELADLGEWLIQRRGRLLCLTGVPGAGKTWLAIKLSQIVAPHFQGVTYRSLGDRRSPLALVTDLLDRLSVPPPYPDSVTGCLALLVPALTHNPSLIVLDVTDGLFRPGAWAGTYEEPFEAYGTVLEVLATHDHQSCIVWISREPPRLSAHLVGSGYHRHRVQGLNQQDLRTLAFWPPTLQATDADWQQLLDRYGGLPYLMQAIVPRLPPFGHNLGACLAALQQDYQFLNTYLEGWLAPLSETEWCILNWLMISRRPLSLTDLNDCLHHSMPLAAIESLCDRGICHSMITGDTCWTLTLPEVLSQGIRDRFLQSFRTVDEAHWMELLHRYPLLQADAPEALRQWQHQQLLQAIAEILATTLVIDSERQAFLQRGLQRSRHLSQTSTAPGHSAGNLINLAQYWQLSLVAVDSQGLALRDADLRSDCFQGVSFAQADFSQTLLAKPLGQSPVIAMSPDQQQVAVGDQDGRLLLWNIHDGRLQQALFTVPDAIEVIAFSGDGGTLAEGRQNGCVRLWDLRSDYGPEVFATTSGWPLKALAISPNKQLLAGGDEAGSLYVWRLASGEQLHQIAAHGAAITAIAFSPCSRWLTTCGDDCAAIEWESSTGEPLRRFQGRLTNWLGTVAYLPTMTGTGVQAVVVGRDEGHLVIWDIQSARPLRIITDPCDLVMAVALSPNGRYLAASDVSNTLSIWHVASRSRLHQLSVSQAPIESLVFSPDSTGLMTGCDYAVQFWHVKSGECLRSWRSDRHPVITLALASNPRQLLSGHRDQTIRCWRPAAARNPWLPHERLQLAGDQPIQVITASFHGRYWAIGTETGMVQVWQGDERQWLTLTMRLSSAITALAWSRDDQYLALGDAAGTVALWDVTASTLCWQQPQTHTDSITALAFSPDNQQLFSGSRDRLVLGWDLAGQLRMTLHGHRRRVHTLCVSVDGQTLYSGSYDGTVRCWDLAQHMCTGTWQQSDRLIHDVTLDAQNHPLVIVSDTQSLEIWHLSANRCRVNLPPHEEVIWHVSVSPDGESLVSASHDGTIRICCLASGQLQEELRVDRPYEGMQIAGCTGITESERHMLYSLGATDF